MSRIMNRIGERLHLHAHQADEVSTSVEDQTHPDDLGWLGLAADHHADHPRADLGQLALLAGDSDEGPDPASGSWDSVI